MRWPIYIFLIVKLCSVPADKLFSQNGPPVKNDEGYDFVPPEDVFLLFLPLLPVYACCDQLGGPSRRDILSIIGFRRVLWRFSQACRVCVHMIIFHLYDMEYGVCQRNLRTCFCIGKHVYWMLTCVLNLQISGIQNDSVDLITVF